MVNDRMQTHAKEDGCVALKEPFGRHIGGRETFRRCVPYDEIGLCYKIMGSVPPSVQGSLQRIKINVYFPNTQMSF